jgi:GT2 family glycosyltransferase
MAASPLPERYGIPGRVVLGFMAGAAVVRVSAYREVGGYDPMFFIGGEEETLAVKLARRGWQLRYREDLVVHHEPSVANAPYLRAFGIRNTLWNSWLHRRADSALRWTAFTLADAPKNADWLIGVSRAARGIPRILRLRRPMSRALDRDYAVLDGRRTATRRPLLNRHDPLRQLRR